MRKLSNDRHGVVNLCSVSGKLCCDSVCVRRSKDYLGCIVLTVGLL